MLHYAITIADHGAHLFQVTISIPTSSTTGHILRLPAWIPGSYMIRDFARHIIDFRADSAQQPLAFKTLDKQTWQLSPNQAEVQVSYKVYAYDLSVRSAYLERDFAFFNHSSLCLSVDDLANSPCQLDVECPADWQLATGLTRISGDKYAAGRFQADTYQQLIDHPMLMGKLTIAEFNAAGVPHALVLAGRHYADLTRICADLQRICSTQIAMFGEQPPFAQYLFLTMVVGRGFGGLEHSNSTALICNRKDLIHKNKSNIDNDYRVFLSLCSHEYFHSWNVKTLKPKLFLPYQLDTEQYTPQLWFYEGFTSYYDDYLLHRAGLLSANAYLAILGETIAKVQRGKGHLRQSVAESSFYAWTKYYKQDENSPNAIVSYYAKGGLIALCVDLKIRLASQHQHDLAAVMADFWQRYGAQQDSADAGTDDNSFADFLRQRYDYQAIAAFVEQATQSTAILPLEELLEQFGITLTRAAAADDNTFSGKAVNSSLPVSLGAKYKVSNQGLELTHVYEGEAASMAGLSAYDRIIAIDYLQVTDATLREIAERFKPGQTVTIHAFHRDELREHQLTWQVPAPQSLQLTVVAAEKLAGWLTL
ncbi:MAG: Uncharacterised protein [Pseudidiomarina mangrovi]|nr:MAG: Uncharacterised protein [Pseudidiomarina mangrovi]